MCARPTRFLRPVSECQISATDGGQDFREAARIDPTDFEIWQKYEETYRQGHRRRDGVRSCMYCTDTFCRQVEGDIAEQLGAQLNCGSRR